MEKRMILPTKQLFILEYRISIVMYSFNFEKDLSVLLMAARVRATNFNGTEI